MKLLFRHSSFFFSTREQKEAFEEGRSQLEQKRNVLLEEEANLEEYPLHTRLQYAT